jgi:Secretion system C-terminal sorting domain
MTGIVRLTLGIIFLMGGGTDAARAQTARAQTPHLTIRTGLPTNIEIQQVIYGNGFYLLTSTYPTLFYRSTDGINWSRESGASLDSIAAIYLYQGTFMAYGNGVFVLVANSGRLFSSSDGLNWTSHPTGTTANFGNVEYIDSQFCAVGDSATLLTSPDGMTWTRRSIGIGSPVDTYTDIFYGNNIFVINAYYQNLNGNNVVYRSTTGLAGTWTADTISPIAANPIRFLRGYFYRMGPHTAISYDAQTWFELSYQDSLSAGGTDAFTDGSRVYLLSANYLTAPPGIITYSEPDGKTFNDTAEIFINAWHGAFLNGQYFVWSENGLTESGDGLHYHLLGNGGYTAATNGTNYVKVGSNVQGSSILSSPDFTDWTQRDSVTWSVNDIYYNGEPQRVGIEPDALITVMYDGSRYLAEGLNDYTSPDGITWAKAGVPVNEFSNIVYGNGLYMADSSGAIFTSRDAITWTRSTLPELGQDTKYPYEIQSAGTIRYLNGRFFIAAVSGYAIAYLTTTDGINFTFGYAGSSTGIGVSTIDDIVYDPDSSKYYFFGTGNIANQFPQFFAASVADPLHDTLMVNQLAYAGGLPSGVTISQPPAGYRVAYNNGHFVSISDVNNYTQPYQLNALIWSADAQNWKGALLNGYTEINSMMARNDSILIEGTNNFEIIADFSGSGTPLPVGLLNFNAIAQNNSTVLLTWETATEQNSRYFVIQRSRDGISFDSIGVVAAAGNSTALLSYSFTDPAPFPGYNDYRLMLMNLDGTQQLSEIKRVWIGQSTKIVVYPNPAKGFLTIENPGGLEGMVTLYDAGGKVVLRQELTGYGSTLSTGGFAAGVYHLVIVQQDGSKYQQQILHVN